MVSVVGQCSCSAVKFVALLARWADVGNSRDTKFSWIVITMMHGNGYLQIGKMASVNEV
jgi:hypothetical protein